MRRLRTVLAASALAVGAIPFAAGAHSSAAGTSLDVYALRGTASAVEVTVKTGYSFVVYPDIQVPSAAASIEAGRVAAQASPADPGESVDALPGLGVPVIEGEPPSIIGQIQAGGGNRIPAPMNGALNTAAGAYNSTVSYVAPQVNPTLVYPYENAQASWPNQAHPGPQRASIGTDVSGTDPTGNLSYDGASGTAYADDGVGVADGGAGVSVAIAPLNLTVGRSSAKVTVTSQGSRVTSDAVSTVHDVDFTPPGVTPPPAPLPGLPGVPTPPPAPAPLLHIGAITSEVQCERDAGASQARVVKQSLQIAGATFAGVPVTIDQNGVTLAGNAPMSVQQELDQLNAAFKAASSLNGPLGQATQKLPTQGAPLIPAGTIVGPASTSTVSHNGNESQAAITGLTLSFSGTLLVPAGTNPPNPTPTPTAAVYTLSLANVTGSAYGLMFPPQEDTSLPPTTFAGTGGGGGSDTTTTITNPGVDTGGGSGAGGTGPARVIRRLVGALVDNPLLNHDALVTLATLGELLLIGSLIACYRMPRKRIPAPDLDLI